MDTTDVDDVALRLAAAAYLSRFTGTSRVHSESDLRLFFAWCSEPEWAPPRTCVIDSVLEHSPAEYVRRPRISNQFPVLGLSHLQFEALLAAARESDNPVDFALVAMLGLLGLRIAEASRASVEDLGEEHGHRVLLVHGKGGKQTLVPLPPVVCRALDRVVENRMTGPVLLNRRHRRMDRHCDRLAETAIVRLPKLHSRLLRHTYASPPRSTPESTSVTSRSPHATPTPEPPDLELGRHAALVSELRSLTAQHPLRERFWHQLMLALRRSGRRAEALAAYQSFSELLSEELGLDPGPELRGQFAAILQAS